MEKIKDVQFLKKKCIYNEGTLFPNEFCLESTEHICSSSHISKGICHIVNYEDNIPEKYRYFSNPKIGGKILTDYCPISFYDKPDPYTIYKMNCRFGDPEYEDETLGTYAG